MCVWFFFHVWGVFCLCVSVYKPAFFFSSSSLHAGLRRSVCLVPTCGLSWLQGCANVHVCVWMDVCREPEIQLQTGTLLESLACSWTVSFLFFISSCNN